jgi:ribosomal protein S18
MTIKEPKPLLPDPEKIRYKGWTATFGRVQKELAQRIKPARLLKWIF